MKAVKDKAAKGVKRAREANEELNGKGALLLHRKQQVCRSHRNELQ